MSCIHYKFRSSLEYKTLTFEGLHISVTDLKRLIYENEKINRSSDFDLQITNAQTKQIYDEDNSLVPRNASVTVARIPAATQQKLPKVWDRSTEGVVVKGYNRLDGSGSSHHEKTDLSKMSDLTEEEKLKKMERESTSAYDPSNFVRRRAVMSGLPPPNYVCNRCHQTGHWINQCPTLNMRRTTGIPKDELMETTPDDPQAMLTPGGTYAVSILHKNAKLQGKKERPPFVDEQLVEVEPEDHKEINDAYLCTLCRGLLKEAMLIDCCWQSFCADCITNRLLESDRHECPNCGRQGISPDNSLLPNTKLRQAVENFQKDIGYGAVRKKVADERGHSATPPPYRSPVDSSSQQSKLKISFNQQPINVQEAPKIETTTSGALLVTTTYFGQGEESQSATVDSSSMYGTTVSSSDLATAPSQVQVQPIVSHPTAVVQPQPVYTDVVPPYTRPAAPISMQAPVSSLSYTHNYTSPASTYPTYQTSSAATVTYPSHVANAQQAYQASYLQYPSQPLPPGISAGSLSSLQSFSRPPPTLVAPPPSHRPLTEEEFYLEKQRLLSHRPTSSSVAATATRDAWEEFLARKDRKKIRSSSSSSSSSGRSRSRRRSSSRSSSRTRSRSRSRRVKYRRRPRRYSRSRSRSPVRRRHRSRSRTHSRSPTGHSTSRHHYSSRRSPEPYYSRPVFSKRPEYMASYPPPPTAPPPPYYGVGSYPGAPAPYNPPIDPRFMKLQYPYDTVPPGLEFPPKIGRNAYPPTATVGASSKAYDSRESPRSDESPTRSAVAKNVSQVKERKKRRSVTPDEKQQSRKRQKSASPDDKSKKSHKRSKPDAVSSSDQQQSSSTSNVRPSTPADVGLDKEKKNSHSTEKPSVRLSADKPAVKRESSTKKPLKPSTTTKSEKATATVVSATKKVEKIEITTKKSEPIEAPMKKQKSDGNKSKVVEKDKLPVSSKSAESNKPRASVAAVESTSASSKPTPTVETMTVVEEKEIIVVEKQASAPKSVLTATTSVDTKDERSSSTEATETEKDSKNKKKKEKKKRKKKHKVDKESTATAADAEGKTKRHHHKKHKKEKRKSSKEGLDEGDTVKGSVDDAAAARVEEKPSDESSQSDNNQSKSKWEERKVSETREIKKKPVTKSSASDKKIDSSDKRTEITLDKKTDSSSSDKKPAPKSTVTKASPSLASSSTTPPSLDKKIITAAENAIMRKVPKPLVVSTTNVHSSSVSLSSTNKRDRKVVIDNRKNLIVRRNR